MTVQQVDIIRRGPAKELGQLRPANTTAASVYSPGSNITARIESIFVCNTTASAAAFRIFVDKDGTTYDETTALFFDSAIAANTTVLIEGLIYIINSAGNLGVRTDTNSALTFTAYGVEMT